MNYEKLKYKDLTISANSVKELMVNRFDKEKPKGWFIEARKDITEKILNRMFELPSSIVDDRWGKKASDDWNSYFAINNKNEQEIINWYNDCGIYPIEIMEVNSKSNIDWWRFVYTVLDKYKNEININILDYGCGTGDIAVLTHEFWGNGNFYAADVSDIMLSFACNMLDILEINKIDGFHKLDLRKITKSNSDRVMELRPDVIFCTDVLEHVIDPISILEKFNAISKKETLLFLMHTFSDFEATPYHLEANKGMGRTVGKYLRSNGWKFLQGWFPPTYGKLYVKGE